VHEIAGVGAHQDVVEAVAVQISSGRDRRRVGPRARSRPELIAFDHEAAALAAEDAVDLYPAAGAAPEDHQEGERRRVDEGCLIVRDGDGEVPEPIPIDVPERGHVRAEAAVERSALDEHAGQAGRNIVESDVGWHVATEDHKGGAWPEGVVWYRVITRHGDQEIGAAVSVEVRGAHREPDALEHSRAALDDEAGRLRVEQ
jgi:hypothetical protein